MSGFANLPGVPLREEMQPLQADEVAFPGDLLDDGAARALVLQDVTQAEQFRSTKRCSAEWETDDQIYRAYVSPRNWPGTDTPRANLGMPLVLETIDTNLLPTTYMAFFSDKQPFLLAPKGKTDPEAARAIGHVLSWEIDESGFAEETRQILKSVFQFGTGVGKWGNCVDKKTVRTYARAGAPLTVSSATGVMTVPTTESETIVPKDTVREFWKPTFEYCDLRNILVDPGCRTQDIRTARYVIHQFFVTADELDALREEAGYENIPSREVLAQILTLNTEPTTESVPNSVPRQQSELQAQNQDLPTSADPLKQPLEILEYWTNGYKISVLQRQIVIRNEKNEFNCLPFVSCSFIDVLNSFYGYGISKLLRGEQLFQQGVVNSWIDGLAMVLDPMWHRKKGLGTSTQQLQSAPGKVVSDDGELAPLEVKSVTAEALQAIQTSEQRAVRRVGANGGDNVPTQALRTAQGINEFTSNIATRMQYFIECFSNLVFKPVLTSFIQMAKDNLKPSQIQNILNDKDGKAYEGEILDLYNGTYQLDVLDSTKLAARRAMSNLIPMLIQLFSSEPVQDSLQVQGMKVNYVELVQQAFDLIGWDSDNVIVPMTEQDLSRASIEQQKAQAAQAAQQQKQQDTLQQIEATGEMRAGVQTVKHILDTSAEQDPASLGL